MMLPFLKFKGKLGGEKLAAGLDIGTQSVKLVKLKLSKDRAELCDFDLVGTQLDLVELLKKLKQEHGLEAVNISCSGPATVIRYVSFPKMKEDELAQALKFEVQKNIPFPVAETNFGGHILKDDLPENKMLVLIAAVKKEFLAQRLKLFTEAALRVNIVELDSLSLVNSFNYNYFDDESRKDKTVALLNIGSSISNLSILEKGIPRLSRDIHIAGNNFTQKLADIFALEFKAAESLKLSPDNERANKIKAAVESVLSSLCADIRTSFDYYESQSTTSVAKIFLSGGGASFSGIKEILANFLGIEVEFWDTFKRLELGAKVNGENAKAASSQLAVAVGLALRQ